VSFKFARTRIVPQTVEGNVSPSSRTTCAAKERHQSTFNLPQTSHIIYHTSVQQLGKPCVICATTKKTSASNAPSNLWGDQTTSRTFHHAHFVTHVIRGNVDRAHLRKMSQAISKVHTRQQMNSTKHTSAQLAQKKIEGGGIPAPQFRQEAWRGHLRHHPKTIQCQNTPCPVQNAKWKMWVSFGLFFFYSKDSRTVSF